jgi:hypothetical protein
MVGWLDSEGNGCNWSRANRLPGCPYYGYSMDGGMGIAEGNSRSCAGTMSVSGEIALVISLAVCSLALCTSSFARLLSSYIVPTPIPTESSATTYPCEAPKMSTAPSKCIGSKVGWFDFLTMDAIGTKPMTCWGAHTTVTHGTVAWALPMTIAVSALAPA